MKVYISATYRDLHRHRLAVATILRRMGQPIGMEDYVAEGAKPLNRCLADVMACDAYVGILAWRYGCVPTDPGSPDTVLPSGAALGLTSITEFEFRQAVESKKEILMFLLDPEAEWPSSQFDSVVGNAEQGKAVLKFREEVGRQHVVGYFRTPEELASLVSAAVYRYEMSRQMDLDSLRIEPGFNQQYIRTGPVESSALMEIQRVIAGPQEVHALQINIGQGFDWWMTRLYFMSSLAADLTSIEVLVFVKEGNGFIGIANPSIVKERLAQAYPLIKQFEDVLAQQPALALVDLAAEVRRRAELWTKHMETAGGEHKNHVFVTKPELGRRLSPYLITGAVDSQPNDNSALQMQRIMDWPMRFVPLLTKGEFSRVVDKQALSEQIARIFVREQVSRALTMTR
jgi:hypothetical protein